MSSVQSIQIPDKPVCFCGKEFKSQMELKLHYNIVHAQKKVKNKITQFNDSDSSDDNKKSTKKKVQKKGKRPNVLKKQKHYFQYYSSLVIPTKNQAITTKEMQGFVQFPTPLDVNHPNYEFKKVYYCGCARQYSSNEQISFHIKKDHHSNPPQNTMVGVYRALVASQFNKLIPRRPRQQQLQVMRAQYIQKSNYRCGCGLSYTNELSLNNHIQKIHNGIDPEGTLRTQNDRNNSNASKTDSQNSQYQIVQQRMQEVKCKGCQERDSKSFWACYKCPSWRVCDRCGRSSNLLKQHKDLQHYPYFIQ